MEKELKRSLLERMGDVVAELYDGISEASKQMAELLSQVDELIANAQLPEAWWDRLHPDYGKTFISGVDPFNAGMVDGLIDQVKGLYQLAKLAVELLATYYTNPVTGPELAGMRVYEIFKGFSVSELVESFKAERLALLEEGNPYRIEHQMAKDVVELASLATVAKAAATGVKSVTVAAANMVKRIAGIEKYPAAAIAKARKLLNEGYLITEEGGELVAKKGSEVVKLSVVNRTDEIIALFRKETGITIKKVSNSELLNSAKQWQGKENYLGVDDWIVVEIPKGTKIHGGLPGQSSFYATVDNLITNGTSATEYWKTLQVMPHKILGYRTIIGEYEVIQDVQVAISKALANTAHGVGGAWQLYIEDYIAVLRLIKEIKLP